jgi:hypothetical protein
MSGWVRQYWRRLLRRVLFTALRGIITDPDFSQDRAMMAQRFGPPAVCPRCQYRPYWQGAKMAVRARKPIEKLLPPHQISSRSYIAPPESPGLGCVPSASP